MTKLMDLLSGKDSTNPNICGMLGEAVKEVNQRRETRLKEHLVQIITDIDDTVKHRVTNLREIRKQEKALKAELDKLEVVKAYFQATGNPGPYFLHICGNTDAGKLRAKRKLVDITGMDIDDIEDSDLTVTG